MSIADEIHQRVQRLPEAQAREVLNFIGYLETQHRLEPAAEPGRLRENPDDVVWQDLLFRQPH